MRILPAGVSTRCIDPVTSRAAPRKRTFTIAPSYHAPMSYDLFLSGLPKAGKLREWFSERGNYQVGDTQAVYQNEATGVYFTFGIEDKKIVFNLNYFRPSFYGLEAEIEV